MTPRAAAGAMAISPARVTRADLWAIALVSPPTNACHHQAAEGCRHRGYPLVAALVNGIVSGHLCEPASTLGGVRDEQVQRQLFHFHPVDTQAQKGSP